MVLLILKIKIIYLLMEGIPPKQKMKVVNFLKLLLFLKECQKKYLKIEN